MRSIAIATALAVGSSLAVPQDATPRTFDVVASITSVTTRDEAGRIETFTDRANRPFRIRYDEHGRLKSVKAVLREHISDVSAIGYDAQGRIAGADIGLRYSLLINYLPDGTQVIRDEFGGLISRQGSLEDGYRIVQQSDPTARLAPAVEGLDALVRAVASN